jgi:predicted DCC family thiol-disulfide oxidoreductase YuxK
MSKYTHHPVILFDGLCNFCNAAVNFTLKRDKKKQLRFAAFQSLAGQQLAQQFGFSWHNMASFVFIENGKTYLYATAALKVCRYLRQPWPLLYALILVPPFLRDGLYKYIAKNRIKWFGTRPHCMIPTPDVKAQFLSE